MSHANLSREALLLLLLFVIRAIVVALSCYTANDIFNANARTGHTHQWLAKGSADGALNGEPEAGKAYWHYNFTRHGDKNTPHDTLLGGWVKAQLQLKPGDLDVLESGEHPKHKLYSQVGQDWLVATLLGCQNNGYFVDLAANDAFDLSNSAFLERDLGWQGVCIDADPEYLDSHRHRKCQYFLAAVGEKDKEMDFQLRNVFSGLISPNMDNKDAGNQPTMKVKTVPWTDIMELANAPKKIDYFSLDVEGAESVVMSGFPWEKYQFRVITVERPEADLVAALQQHGYEKVHTNSNFNDQLWLKRDATFAYTFQDIKDKFAQGVEIGFKDSCMTREPFHLAKPQSLQNRD